MSQAGAAEDADGQHRDALFAAVYDELRRLARTQLARERPGHTLQPTALVHEAWMRLSEQRELDLGDRARFLGLAATMMRRILVNHARDRAVVVFVGDCGHEVTNVLAIEAGARRAS